MNEGIQRIGCILMASGLSQRYGKNKLLELLDGREIILHTADRLIEAGLQPLTVTRSPDVKVLLDREGIACVLHDGPLKSDTIHRGLENLPSDTAGFLFMPADQPLVRSASLRRMAVQFFRNSGRAVRLCFGQTPGSPVIRLVRSTSPGILSRSFLNRARISPRAKTPELRGGPRSEDPERKKARHR